MTVVQNHSEEAIRLLGPIAAMISPSKSGYTHDNPGHVALFNARVYNAAGEEIWCGDLDVTQKIVKLCVLARIEGPILVTPERFWEDGPGDFLERALEEDGSDEAVERRLRSELLFPFHPDRLTDGATRVLDVSEEFMASRVAAGTA